jgi:hypothetical protein
MCGERRESKTMAKGPWLRPLGYQRNNRNVAGFGEFAEPCNAAIGVNSC